MTTGEIPQTIAIETDIKLRALAKDCAAKNPFFSQLNAALFPTVYEGGVDTADNETLINGNETSLTVASYTPAGDRLLFVNIDLGPDSPAAIVHPELVPSHKPRESVLARTFVRLLTEAEGVALANDLNHVSQLQNP